MVIVFIKAAQVGLDRRASGHPAGQTGLRHVPGHADAANHKIAMVGRSRQIAYNPYRDPERAVKEEFGDLLAEGLYTRLEHDLAEGSYARPNHDLVRFDVDEAYWAQFIKTRENFLDKVARLLAARLTAADLKDGEEAEIRAAQISVSAARRQLARIDRDLCQRFIELWRSDLAQWRDYITGDKLPRLDKHSIGQPWLTWAWITCFRPATGR